MIPCLCSANQAVPKAHWDTPSQYHENGSQCSYSSKFDGLDSSETWRSQPAIWRWERWRLLEGGPGEEMSKGKDILNTNRELGNKYIWWCSRRHQNHYFAGVISSFILEQSSHRPVQDMVCGTGMSRFCDLRVGVMGSSRAQSKTRQH